MPQGKHFHRTSCRMTR